MPSKGSNKRAAGCTCSFSFPPSLPRPTCAAILGVAAAKGREPTAIGSPKGSAKLGPREAAGAAREAAGGAEPAAKSTGGCGNESGVRVIDCWATHS